MGSRPKRAVDRSVRKTRRRRFCRAGESSKTAVDGGGGWMCSSVSEKLEALKSLIPAQNGERKADQLFQETADYIVLLRSQVLVLQRLISLYGSSDNQNLNAAV